jgi:hypothetical protein
MTDPKQPDPKALDHVAELRAQLEAHRKEKKRPYGKAHMPPCLFVDENGAEHPARVVEVTDAGVSVYLELEASYRYGCGAAAKGRAGVRCL